ncbi:proteasome subunit beta type [Thecamonas trahens ATCC 50062]|uniref:Proteasome subunit beta n=1 Tax=Thecamonas trahens ATCC 50062 TaxID=461836 RepID=A0A0L0DN64_THETB|nr:proteasome subunit beta type [Thecamonas trahens ATCC 50062]KNC53749.1 proteasome subunit beta type [Thecamonas trahens ATCC 50062]|eukprot:XP_013754312.1 proteasome subunit beta type [Thecamonas trahens ATCC 50062]
MAFPMQRELYLPTVPTLTVSSQMHSGLSGPSLGSHGPSGPMAARLATGKQAPVAPSRFSAASSSSAAVTVGSGPKTAAFSPYVLNGGTALALAGKDFCIVAGDTRMSAGYEIHTRNKPKTYRINDKCSIAMAGMQADATNLIKMLRFRIAMYERKMGKPMSTQSLAQLVSTTLYRRRFFPIYAFVVIGGLDEDGVGSVYGYDAVGSFERSTCCVQGSGTSLLQPVLDNQFDFKNHSIKPDELTLDESIDLVKDVFVSAGERDIYTGDSVEMHIITADGVRVETFDLKRD